MTELTDDEILERASQILFERSVKHKKLNGPQDAFKFLELKMAKHDVEVFGVLLMAPGHKVIEYRELVKGTVGHVTAYPREILRAVVETNATAIVLVHSHPLSSPKPSQEDIAMTKLVKEFTDKLGVWLMDHYIIGETNLSMRFQGFMELFKEPK